MDLGEAIVDAAVREVLEETGINCRVTGLVGIYTNPNHVLKYTSNGEVRQFSIVFTAVPTGGEPTPSRESTRVEWASAARMDDYHFHPSMRMRIDHYLTRAGDPYLG